MRTMYDAVTPTNIPRDAEMVAGYVNGPYAWSAADWALFPNAIKVTIATHPDNTTSIVIDYEYGDFSDTDVVDAVKVRIANRGVCTVYCSESKWAHVSSVLGAAGIDMSKVLWWIAAYPGAGAGTVPSGAVAHQYEDYNNLYDISTVLDYWEGVDNMTDPFTQPSGVTYNGAVMSREALVEGVFEALFMGGTDFSPSVKVGLTDLVNAVAAIQKSVDALTTAVAGLSSGKVADGPYYLTTVAPSGNA